MALTRAPWGLAMATYLERRASFQSICFVICATHAASGHAAVPTHALARLAKAPAVWDEEHVGPDRCKVHGGLSSTGPKTDAERDAIRASNRRRASKSVA